jgi:hypothetical protein
LRIDSSTGKIESKQNVDVGFTETVCIECGNADGSKITYDNWKVYQKPNCGITLSKKSISNGVFDYDTSKTSTSIF